MKDDAKEHKPSLKRNVSWMFLGNGFYAFTQWLQLSLIAKFCSPLDLGRYTLALAVVAPVFMFSGLQLRAIQVTDVKEEWRFGDYFTLRTIAVFFSLFCITFYVIFSADEELLIFLLMALLKTVEGLAEVFNSKQQLHEQMKNISISFVLKGLSATFSIGVGLYFFHSLILGLFLAVCTNLCVMIFNDYRKCLPLLSDKRLFIFDKKRLQALLFRALPLGIVMLMISLNTNVSKYFAEHFLGTESQGVYSTIAYLIVLGNFVNTAVGQSFTPRLSRYYAENRIKEFVRLKNKFLLLSLAIGISIFIGTLLLGRPLLTILFNKHIAEYHHLFSLVMFSGIFIYCASAAGYTLTSMRLFKIQPYINVSVFIVNCISSYFLISRYGLYGITYAAILSFFTQFVITSLLIRKNLILQTANI